MSDMIEESIRADDNALSSHYFTDTFRNGSFCPFEDCYVIDIVLLGILRTRLLVIEIIMFVQRVIWL